MCLRFSNSKNARKKKDVRWSDKEKTNALIASHSIYCLKVFTELLLGKKP